MHRLAFSLLAAFATAASAGTYTFDKNGTLNWSDAEFSDADYCVTYGGDSGGVCRLAPAVGVEGSGGFELLLDRSPNSSASQVFVETSLRPSSGVDIRFSWSSLTVNLNAYDALSGNVLASYSGTSDQNRSVVPVLNFNAGRVQHIRVVATWDFMPGQGLVPSSDPSCAAFDCMTRSTDRLELGRTYVYLHPPVPVPEPATVGLLLMGFALMTAGVRRRVDRHDI